MRSNGKNHGLCFGLIRVGAGNIYSRVSTYTEHFVLGKLVNEKFHPVLLAMEFL